MADQQWFLDALGAQIRDARHRREVQEEIRCHIEEYIADLSAQGVPEVEARKRAIAAFGDPKRLGITVNRVFAPWDLLLHLSNARLEQVLIHTSRILFALGIIFGIGLFDLGLGPFLQWVGYDLTTQPFPTLAYPGLRGTFCAAFMTVALRLDRSPMRSNGAS